MHTSLHSNTSSLPMGGRRERERETESGGIGKDRGRGGFVLVVDRAGEGLDPL